MVGTITFKDSGTTRLTTTKSYDNLNRLGSASHLPSVSSAFSVVYEYNSANQRTKAVREDNAYWNYGYDALGQVTSGKKHLGDATPINGLDFGWTFDDIGNRKTSTTNSQITQYTPNILNQYAQRTVAGVLDVFGAATTSATVTVALNNGAPLPTTRQGEFFFKQLSVENSAAAQYPSLKITGVKNLVGANGEDAVTEITKTTYLPKTPETFAYDADGNLTDDARWHYTWDAENRLAAMQTLSTVATVFPAMNQRLEFVYDGQGRRISKKVYNWNGAAWVLGTSTRFIHDGWNLLAELNALNSNAVVSTYVWGADLSGSSQGAGGVGGLLFSNLGSATHASAYDGNGNVIGLVDMATGAKSATYDYNAFGETVQSDGVASAVNHFRFSTKYTDDETGLLYYGLRYYNSSTGRWLSRDPIEERGGVNLYGMIGNDAINYRDYLGLRCCELGQILITGLSYSAVPSHEIYNLESILKHGFEVVRSADTLNSLIGYAGAGKAITSAALERSAENLKDAAGEVGDIIGDKAGEMANEHGGNSPDPIDIAEGMLSNFREKAGQNPFFKRAKRYYTVVNYKKCERSWIFWRDWSKEVFFDAKPIKEGGDFTPSVYLETSISPEVLEMSYERHLDALEQSFGRDNVKY